MMLLFICPFSAAYQGLSRKSQTLQMIPCDFPAYIYYRDWGIFWHKLFNRQQYSQGFALNGLKLQFFTSGGLQVEFFFYNIMLHPCRVCVLRDSGELQNESKTSQPGHRVFLLC